ncbi:hypothetical protein BN85407470 [Alteracholeplasma palmae J233]|uniref:Uncharacterized protein n=1 Tax=Alteracholeplasma palmae (strain ATCC 49389 / J233) TaxID=1318466 RepID=U4KKN0_ALTPJ|nr:hypothetical protein [Alteracholeplasma palmae]CCV64324.1 hypothetical protein BN85407470 [Alteracholeplasma palmae J233]
MEYDVSEIRQEIELVKKGLEDLVCYYSLKTKKFRVYVSKSITAEVESSLDVEFETAREVDIYYKKLNKDLSYAFWELFKDNYFDDYMWDMRQSIKRYLKKVKQWEKNE